MPPPPLSRAWRILDRASSRAARSAAEASAARASWAVCTGRHCSRRVALRCTGRARGDRGDHHLGARRERVKLLDFGIAKLAIAPGDAGLDATTPHTSTNSSMGTPAYMAPEQGRRPATRVVRDSGWGQFQARFIR